MDILFIYSIIPFILSLIWARIPFWPTEVRYGSPTWVQRETAVTLPLETDSYSRSTVYIPTDTGDLLDAWLYKPKSKGDGKISQSNPSCLIMAHGLVSELRHLKRSGHGSPRSSARAYFINPGRSEGHGPAPFCGDICSWGILCACLWLQVPLLWTSLIRCVLTAIDNLPVLLPFRGFGGSTGAMRNWVSPSRHVDDWLSALKAVKVITY